MGARPNAAVKILKCVLNILFGTWMAVPKPQTDQTEGKLTVPGPSVSHQYIPCPTPTASFIKMASKM